MKPANYRITALQVEGFRGFTTPQSFAFQGRNVFIFGLNGHGKSSIIEAIQWCLFGGSDIEVRNTIYETQECRVSLQLTGPKGNISIERELRPGRTTSDRLVRDADGKEVNLRDVFPQLAKLRSQNESARVIFAAQHAESRRVPADITEFGKVLCFYLKVEDVPELIRKLSDLLQEQQTQLEEFAAKIETISARYSQDRATLQAQVDTLLGNPPWGDGPAPTRTETAQRIVAFVREISRLVNQDCPEGLSPADLLRKAEEWLARLGHQGTTHFQQRLKQLSVRIQQIETALSDLRTAEAAITQAATTLRDLQQREAEILASKSREEIVEEIRLLERAQSKASAVSAMAERAAKLCEEHLLEVCPVCGTEFEYEALLGRVRSQLADEAKFEAEITRLDVLRSRLMKLDEVIAGKATADEAHISANGDRDIAFEALATLTGQEGQGLDSSDIETRLGALKNDLASLNASDSHQRSERQILLSRLKSYSQELNYHNYWDRIANVERKLTVGMEEAHYKLRSYQDFHSHLTEMKGVLEAAFKNALDRAIPHLNDLLTEVYQRLTQQRSFQLVRVYHDPERVGHLEIRVASKRHPDTTHPVNVLNGQASRALHLVPYFVFSRFQPEVLELDMLLIDDPSESFDTSHVALLVDELRIAAEHAQLIVASHEQDKFTPQITARLGADTLTIYRVTDFDPDLGPKIDRG